MKALTVGCVGLTVTLRLLDERKRRELVAGHTSIQDDAIELTMVCFVQSACLFERGSGEEFLIAHFVSSQCFNVSVDLVGIIVYNEDLHFSPNVGVMIIIITCQALV